METIERGLFPWSRKQETKSGQFMRGWTDKVVKMRATGAIKDQAHFYFNLPDEDYKARNALTISIIEEYEVLNTMYKKFGIKPHELEDYDANWIDEIMTVIGEDHKAQNAKMKKASS